MGEVVVGVGKEEWVVAAAAARHLQLVFLIAEALELVGGVEIGEAGDELSWRQPRSIGRRTTRSRS